MRIEASQDPSVQCNTISKDRQLLCSTFLLIMEHITKKLAKEIGLVQRIRYARYLKRLASHLRPCIHEPKRRIQSMLWIALVSRDEPVRQQ
jgi:hypothetical protein